MTHDRYARILAEVRDQVWAITPSKLAAITSLLNLRAAGLTLTPADVQARIGGEPRDRPELLVTSGGIGLVQVFGVLSQRMNMIAEASGGTSTEQLTAEFRALRDDPRVRGIVFVHDSPGGGLYGIDEADGRGRVEPSGERVVLAVRPGRRGHRHAGRRRRQRRRLHGA
jgi:ClpP class serine protease